LDFRKLILKEITEGKKLTVIEIGLSPGRAISQSLYDSRSLNKPLPGHRDDSKELQIQGGIRSVTFLVGSAPDMNLILWHSGVVSQEIFASS
jgi:hypothetical protein